MSVFQDTWKLDIDQALAGQLEKLDGRIAKLENTFSRTADAAADLKREQREAAAAAKELQKQEKAVAKAAKDEARALSKAEREASRAAKAMERDAARAAKALTREMNKAKRATDRETASLKKAKIAAETLGRENLKKGLEGIAQGMQFGAISGERLANGWLAAGAAAGTVAFGGIAMVKSAIDTYITKSAGAKKASDNLTKAWEQMQIAAVKSQMGSHGLSLELDRNTVRLNELSKALFPPGESLKALSEEEEKYVQSGFTDSIQFKLSAVGLLVNGTELAIEKFDEMFAVEEKLSEQGSKNMRKHFEDISFAIEEATGSLDDFIDGIKQTGGKVLDFLTPEKKKGKGGAAKKITAEAAGFGGFGQFTKAEEDIFAAKEATEAWRQKLAALDLEQTIVAPFKQTAAEFEALQLGATDMLQIQQASRAELKKLGLGAGGPFETQGSQIEALDSAFRDFAEGGVMLAVDSFGLLVESMAAGTFSAGEFGQATLGAIGGWLTQLGESAIAAGLIGDFFQKGGLITSPGTGIALGIAAVALGSALSGFGSRGGGKSGGGGGRADRAARQTARALTDRRSEREDKEDAEIIVVMDRKEVGRAMRADNAQALRRGQFSSRGVRS